MIFLSTALLTADLVTKYLALSFVKTPLVLIDGFFEISVHMNTGIAFSIPLPNIFMIVVTPIILGAFYWMVRSSFKEKLPLLVHTGLTLVLTGGIGNLINRITHGAVIDMISFSFWPSFNLADSYITIGCFLILFYYGKITLTHDKRS